MDRLKATVSNVTQKVGGEEKSNTVSCVSLRSAQQVIFDIDAALLPDQYEPRHVPATV